MKAFLWSLCLHLVVVGLLTYHHFVPDPAAKVPVEPPILAYAYQPIQIKPAPTAPAPVKKVLEQATVNTVKKPSNKPVSTKNLPKQRRVKSQPSKDATATKPTAVKTKTASLPPPQPKPFIPVRRPAMVKPVPVAKTLKVAPATVLPKPTPAPRQVAKPPVQIKPRVKAADTKTNNALVQHEVKQTKVPVPAGAMKQYQGITNKALQAAKQGDTSAVVSWKEKQKQLALEITAVKAGQKRELGSKVKSFTDGSSLINTNGKCWRVPPPEAGKDAIWLHTSVSCNPGSKTKVEKINDILQKRRTYSTD